MPMTAKQRAAIDRLREDWQITLVLPRLHYDMLFVEVLNILRLGRWIRNKVPPGSVEVSEDTARKWADIYEAVSPGEIFFLPSAYVRMVGRACRRYADRLKVEREANEAAEAAEAESKDPGQT